MHIRELNQMDYEEFIALEDYSFQSNNTIPREERMEEIWENSIRLGAFSDEDRLQSALIIRDYEIYLNGKTLKMGGVGNVASYPEHRGQGNVNELFIEALKIMKRKKKLISYLAPFSYKFYRRYGYELLFEERLYTILPTEFNRLNTHNHSVLRASWEDHKNIIIDLYHKKFELSIGPIKRQEWSWNEKKGKSPYFSLCYDERGNPEGYIMYHFTFNNGRKMVIDELVGLSVKAEKALWDFVSAHGPQVSEFTYKTSSNQNLTYIFNEPRLKQVYHYGMMGRIVDITDFLEIYPFSSQASEGNFLIEVSDDTAQWNNGIYKLTLGLERNFVEKVENSRIIHDHILSSDIQNWTQIFMGARTMEDIHYQGHLQGDLKIIEQFQKVIPNKTPELFDYY